MSKKSFIIILCSILFAGIVAVGTWQYDNIKDFINVHILKANASVTQPVTPPEEKPPVENPAFVNCGVLNTENEVVYSWQKLLDDNIIAETENGIFATEKFNTIENVSLRVPNTYTEIAPTGFKDCENLKEIYLPEGLTTIHFEAFKNCTNLEKVSYPTTAINVIDNVFEGCSKLNFYEDSYGKYLGNETNNYVYLAEAKNVMTDYGFENIYSFISNQTLVIGSKSFKNIQSTKLIIPNNVIAICGDIKGYFTGCYIPSSVQVLAPKDDIGGCGYILNNYDTYALFEDDTKKETFGNVFNNESSYSSYIKYGITLEKMKLNFYNSSDCDIAGLYNYYIDNCYTWQETLNNEFFAVSEDKVLSRGNNYSNLDNFNLKLPEDIVEIGDSCFSNSNINTICLSNSIKKIGKNAFSGTYMAEIDLKNVEIIEENSFNNCELCIVSTNGKLKHIGANAFKGCPQFSSFYNEFDTTTLKIPDSVETIGVNAFKGNTKIENIVLSGSMTEFDENIFSDCTNLKSYYIPANITSVVFANSSANIPNNVLYYFENIYPTNSDIAEDISSKEPYFKNNYTKEQYLAEVVA